MKILFDRMMRSPEAGTGAAPIVDPAAPPAAAPPADYWPEGLDPQFKGADAKATLDNLAKGLKGYRDRDAARDVPKSPEGYYDYASIKDFAVTEAEKPYFENLKGDVAFEAMAKQLMADGVERGPAMRAYKAGLAAMAESGWLLPLVDETTERAAMLPEAARSLPKPDQDAAIDRRVNDAAGFLKLASETMGLPKGAAAYGDAMLTDRADGLALIEWAKAQAQKGGPSPLAAPGQGGGETRESLKAGMAALNPSDPDYQVKYQALEQRYQKFFA